MAYPDDLSLIETQAIALDLANTLDWHASAQPQETLFHYGDLLEWAVRKGIVDETLAASLRAAAIEAPEVAAAVFARALTLREAIYDTFAAVTRGESPPIAALATVNDEIRRAGAHQHLVDTGAGFIWAWEMGPRALDCLLWPTARSAGDLLTSPHLDRVRQCADDRGCGFLFFDSTRNRSRRWCTMESCGNRAKAKRHYARSKGEEGSGKGQGELTIDK